jgi:glycosyltransferase involved in cell wall biosynthesis
MAGERVSVIVPVYQVEPYVGAAVQSVLAQTHADFELIAVDDGSPDGSFDVLRSFSDPRLRAMRQPRNLGVAAARNTAIAAATGDFLALLDADDLMHPTRLARQLAFMKRHPDIAVCGAWCRSFGPEPDSRRQVARVVIDPRAVNASLVFGNIFCTSSLMLRREAVPPGGFRQRYAEDYDFLVRVGRKHRLAIMREALVDYRIRPGSAMHTIAMEKKKRDVWDSQQPLFQALGIVPTDEEREIHLFARNNAGNVDQAQLERIHRWYARLVDANRRSRVFPDDAFRAAASRMWFEQLYHATGCGTDALKMYLGSPLSFAHPQPLALRAKFLAKALMGRHFVRAVATA